MSKLLAEALAAITISKELTERIDELAKLIDEEVPHRSRIVGRYDPESGPSLPPVPLPQFDAALDQLAQARAAAIVDGAPIELWSEGDALALLAEVAATRFNRLTVDLALRQLHGQRHQAEQAGRPAAFAYLQSILDEAMAELMAADSELGDITTADEAIRAGAVEPWQKLTTAVARIDEVRQAQDRLYPATDERVENLRRLGWLSIREPQTVDPRLRHQLGEVDVPTNLDGDRQYHQAAEWPAPDIHLRWHTPSTRSLEFMRWLARRGVRLACPTLEDAQKLADAFAQAVREPGSANGLSAAARSREQRRVAAQVTDPRGPASSGDVIRESRRRSGD